MRGGNTPECMFIALVPQKCLNGDPQTSSTYFQRHGVKDMNITLNGNSVNGYPISCEYGSAILPLQKFLSVTEKHYNIEAGDTFTIDQFKSNWIWSHKFEAETSSQGWIGINFTLDQPFTENMCMVVWVVSASAITIDKYHQVERLNL